MNSKIPNYTSEFERNGVRIGSSYTDYDDLINYYNLSRIPDFNNAAEPYLSYIIMTRPDIMFNWRSAAGANNINALKANSMTAAFMNDSNARQAFEQLTDVNPSRFIPLITTRAKSYSVSDVEIKTIEKGGTFFGHLIKYAKHSEEHKISNTITIDFRNDKYRSILNMCYMWMCYMYHVSKNDTLKPKDYYQKNGILDYAGSIYYLVTRRDGRELVYWEKLVGVFPTKVPMSMFTHSESMILEDTVSIDFAYGVKADICDPAILIDINTLHGLSTDGTANLSKSNNPTGRVQMSAYEYPFVKGDVYAKRPYIHVVKNSKNGTLKYYLDWVK